MPEALNYVCWDEIQKFWGRARRFEAIYRQNVSVNDVEKVLKVTGHRYKSHRKSENQVLERFGITEQSLAGLCYCSDCTGSQLVCRASRCPKHSR